MLKRSWTGSIMELNKFKIMKTAMQELWEYLDDAERNGVYELGTQNFKRYIEGIYFQKEKEQIIEAHAVGRIKEVSGINTDGEDYYNETFIK